MLCKACRYYNKGDKLQLRDNTFELIGSCGLSGAEKRPRDKCTSGNYELK
jgi:hypothetical protein